MQLTRIGDFETYMGTHRRFGPRVVAGPYIPLFAEKTQLQPQAHPTQHVARAVADRNPTVVAVFE